MPISRFHGRTGRLLIALGGWPRRIAALLCLCVALLSAVGTRTAKPTGSTSAVLVVSRDLAAGTVLSARDVSMAAWPHADVPRSAVHDQATVLGHPIGAAMARGEPLTTARMLDTAIIKSLAPEQVAATITLADPGQAAIVRTGVAIDVYLGSGSTGVVLSDGKPVPAVGVGSAGAPIAANVRVIAVLPLASASAADPGGLTIVLAVGQSAASQLSHHPSGPFIATLRPPS